MSDELYAQVDEYLDGLFGPSDPVLTSALDRSAGAGLPTINVAQNQGRLLGVLALACGARSILEIGTLGGYSTIWLGRSLPPDGRLVSLELEPAHAEVARRNVADAGLADRVEIRVGRALDLLDQLASTGDGPFDMVFIDADKVSYPQYLRAVVDLGRPGTLVVADNIVHRGDVMRDEPTDANVVGLKRFNEMLAADERLAASFVQVVGSKGHDGLAIAVIR